MTTLLFNGRIHSPSVPHATAMAVDEGVIVWVGNGDADFPHARRYDLDGALVTPAFVDAHVHLTATGLTMTGLDLARAATKQHCLILIEEHARRHPGQPIWGHGWDDTTWSTPLTTDELDAVTGNVPAYISRIDVHSAVASTALRQRISGLSAARGFDPQRPLTADAHHLVRAEARHLLTWRQRAEARTAALDAAARKGIVAVHECAGPDIGGAEDWAELRGTDHPVDVIGYWGEAVGTAAQARALIDTTGAAGLAGDLFVDGALGSRTAHLCQPYADAPGKTGNAYLDDTAIEEHFVACTEAGVTAGFHVIGDAAVTSVVNALERTVERFGVQRIAGCGHRLEHLEMVTAEQAAKLGAWGITASMQPSFDALWGGNTGMYSRRLGPQRAAGLNPLALLASANVRLAFGSDTPVTSMNPWEWVKAASRHHTPGSAISVDAAIAASITEHLAPGAAASYAIWDKPISGKTAWDTTALDARQTVHRGVVIHG